MDQGIQGVVKVGGAPTHYLLNIFCNPPDTRL